MDKYYIVLLRLQITSDGSQSGTVDLLTVDNSRYLSIFSTLQSESIGPEINKGLQCLATFV